MAKTQKRILKQNYDMLLSAEVQKKYHIDPCRVMAATSAHELDEAYNR